MKRKNPHDVRLNNRSNSKKAWVLSLVLLAGTTLFAQKATDNFAGKWKTPDGVTIVISKTGDAFNGFPDGKKTAVLTDLKFKDGKWSGVINNPVENKSANCTVLLDGSKLKIVAKKGLMSKTVYWTRL